MGQRSLLILCGKLQRSSFLRLQLGLPDTYGFRLGAEPYRRTLETAMEKIEDAYDLIWDSELNSPRTDQPMTVGTVKAFLNRKIPGWRQYRNITVYFTEVYFRDWGFLREVLAKAALSDQPVVVGCDPALCSFPSGVLDEVNLQERDISSLERSIPIDAAGKFLNLGRDLEVFRISKISTPARHFNEFAARGPYLSKRSRSAEKVKGEYAYLGALPAEIRPYFPCVGALRESGGAAEYDVEFVPMFDASRFLIHASVPAEMFGALFEKIDEYRGRCPRRKVGAKAVQGAMKALFIEKLRGRAAQLADDRECARVLELAGFIESEGFTGVMNRLAGRLEARLGELRDEELVFSHGDLCLSNILFDRRTLQLKLIDPRGPANPDDSYLPWYYDLAKLSHSLLGHYDLITNGLSHLEFDTRLESQLRFELPADFLKGVRGQFRAWVARHGWDYELLRLCEASLFFSMLPLHKDKPNHMIQQFLAGMRAMREAGEEA